MEKTALTPGEMAKARKKLYNFTFFSIISFTLLSGNIITLFSLRLGAGNFLIGLLSSFMYISYLFILIGRSLVKKYGLVKLMGRFWLLRYLSMIPILFTPIFTLYNFWLAAYVLIVISVLGFNVARGIATTSYNPIIGEITVDKERGAFLARLQAINHTVTLPVVITMAIILGRDAPIYRYTIFILVGIICGFYATYIFFKIPEPGKVRESLSENLWKGFFDAVKRDPFRKFIKIHFLASFATYMITPFLIVYVKQVYHQPDNMIVFYTVFGSLGAILMALVSGFMIDRLGAKPLYFLFSCVITLALIPMIASPEILNQKAIWFFFAAVFFFHNMGSYGTHNSGQTYFFAAITPEERLNLGVVYYLTQGLGGGIGALLGGIILGLFQSYYPNREVEIFQIYFGFLAAFCIIILFLISNMENLGAYSIGNVLAVIFSPRDLRAISMLNRLDRSRTLSEEKKTIRALAASKSELPVHDILQKLRSPRFIIRKEALTTLSSLPVDKQVISALISEVKNCSFTTAYLAADIIGKKGISDGVKILRESLNSKDYFLSGKSMVSLARLNDRESIPVIKDIISKTTNPRLTIHGAAALEIFRDSQAIPVLLSKLEKKTSPYLRDEIILSIAGILGIGEWFYPHYVSFLEQSILGISGLEDYIREQRVLKIPQDQIQELLESLPQRNRSDFTSRAVELLNQLNLKLDGVDISVIFRDTLMDIRFTRLDRFCFLIIGSIVWFSTLTHTK